MSGPLEIAHDYVSSQMEEDGREILWDGVCYHIHKIMLG